MQDRLSFGKQNQQEFKGTTSNNVCARFSCNYSFLAANSLYIITARPQETSPNSCQYVSIPADVKGSPVNRSDPSGMFILSGAAQWAGENYFSSTNNGFTDDYTDIVSRALHFGGGAPETCPGNFVGDEADKHDPDYWFQSQDTYEFTAVFSCWTNTYFPSQHLEDIRSSIVLAGYELRSNYSNLPSNSGIMLGVLVDANWKDGKFNGTSRTHVGTFIKVINGQPMTAQHTSSTIDLLSDWHRYLSTTSLWSYQPNEG
ncbi:MAG: hypothetical protein HKL80_11300 [Acidimicrobiales bacterium]|nr:hypothetical protein [Acidimicrobiales bacterium]